MKSVYSVLFWILRVCVMTFVVGLILPHFDNIVLAAGLQNSLVVATLFTLVGMGLHHVLRLASRLLGGAAGVLLFLAGCFLLPALSLIGVAALLPTVLVVKTFGAAFGAGLVTLAIDMAVGIVFGLIIAALTIKSAVEKARAQRDAQKRDGDESGPQPKEGEDGKE